MVDISNQLTKAIKDRDLIMVRSVILTYINKDRRSIDPQVLEISKYIEIELEKVGIQLFEEDDHQINRIEKEYWNKELWTLLKAKLNDNFSRDKLLYIIDLMTYFRKTGHEYFQPIIKDEKFNKNDHFGKVKFPDRSKKALIIASITIVVLVIGGITITLLNKV